MEVRAVEREERAAGRAPVVAAQIRKRDGVGAVMATSRRDRLVQRAQWMLRSTRSAQRV
jgi:hypothetical protein